MKKYILVFLSFLLIGFCPTLASAQWDYGQDMVWNTIENRIDRRRKANKGKKAPAKPGKSTGNRTGGAPAVALHRNSVEFHRDTWQDFHLNEGYVVNFTFTPVQPGNAPPIIKTYAYNMIDSTAYYKDIKEGSYKVTAEAIYKGKKYRVYLATIPAEYENQSGGNYAPSTNLTVRQYVDVYKTRVIGGSPDTIYIRVID